MKKITAYISRNSAYELQKSGCVLARISEHKTRVMCVEVGVRVKIADDLAEKEGADK